MKRSDKIGILMFLFLAVLVVGYVGYLTVPYKTISQRMWDPLTGSYYEEDVQVRDHSGWYTLPMALSTFGITVMIFPLMYFVKKEAALE